MILPNVNFKEIDVDLERSKVNEKNHTVSNSNAYDDDDDEVFIGKDLAHAKAHSEEISGEIDKEVKRIID